MSLADDIRDLFARNSGDYEPSQQEIDAINDGLDDLLSTGASVTNARMTGLYEALMRQNIAIGDEAYLILRVVGVPPDESQFAKCINRAIDANERAKGDSADECAARPLAERLIAAIEGECDGLAITSEQASNILAYLQYGAAMDAPAQGGEFVFPPMPRSVVTHDKLGPMFDRLAMQFYADKCMQLAARPVQTGDRLTEDQLREMYARAKAMTEGAWIDMMGRALLAASTASDKQEAVLDKPAQVSATRFGKGVKWATVIGAAQRYYEFMQTPEKEALRIENARAFIEGLAAPLATPSDKQEADEKKLTRWQRAQMAFGGGDVPDAAPLAQSAEQDRIDAERWRAFKRFAHHSYNQKVTSHAHSASLMKEHFITVHAASWDELESHIDAAGASK